MKEQVIRVCFLTLISLGFLVFCLELWENFSRAQAAKTVTNESFDPSLARLTSVTGLVAYCDSIYGKNAIQVSDSEQYAGVVSDALRRRFYHGYSYYSLGQNSLGYLFAPLIRADLNAIVMPNDILKHPMAACSQQSIIGMETFKRKGFNVRKIGFFAKGYGGHFCFETYFSGKWHFFDPDMEPDISVMTANHFPAIADIVQNPSLLRDLYAKKDLSFVQNVFPTYTYGPVNEFPAPRARLYQYITKYLSYTSWLLLLLVYLLVQRKLNHSTKKEQCVELPDMLVLVPRA